MLSRYLPLPDSSQSTEAHLATPRAPHSAQKCTPQVGQTRTACVRLTATGLAGQVFTGVMGSRACTAVSFPTTAAAEHAPGSCAGVVWCAVSPTDPQWCRTCADLTLQLPRVRGRFLTRRVQGSHPDRCSATTVVLHHCLSSWTVEGAAWPWQPLFEADHIGRVQRAPRCPKANQGLHAYIQKLFRTASAAQCRCCTTLAMAASEACSTAGPADEARIRNLLEDLHDGFWVEFARWYVEIEEEHGRARWEARKQGKDPAQAGGPDADKPDQFWAAMEAHPGDLPPGVKQFVRETRGDSQAGADRRRRRAFYDRVAARVEDVAHVARQVRGEFIGAARLPACRVHAHGIGAAWARELHETSAPRR